MCAEAKSPAHKPRHYQIVVAGRIDVSWSEWFSTTRIALQTGADGAWVTVLTGALADQAALRGLLNRIWDLNLVLISIKQVDPAA